MTPVFTLLGRLIIILSASSWFTAWIGLELNIIAFLPIIITNNKLSSESALKYFFAQVTGSILIFFFILYSYLHVRTFLFERSYFTFSDLIFMALLLRLGAAPFHFWFPAIVEGLSWNTTLILMTAQKIGPLSLIIMVSSLHIFLVFFFALFSALVGAIRGFNQLICRKLISYSSISHLGWLLCSTRLSKPLIVCYFSFYFLITSVLIIIFKIYSSFHINQIFYFQNFLIVPTIIFYLNLLSLGGLPPFMGFLPKWLLIKTILRSFSYFLILLLVFRSIITLYFYLRLTYSALIVIYFKPVLASYQNKIISPIKSLVLLPLLLFPLMCLFL